ncbi:MAG TPA: hypothetical protein VEZ70_11170 [Allosphingosinicella sp.]|nr:hypothetical protein [Allosphingosinicella sp.]
MATNFAEWLVRTVMLVLAGLVTLSILGSIAAMSNDAAPGPARGPAERIAAPLPEQPQQPQQPSPPSAAAPSPTEPPAEPPPAATGAGDFIPAPAPPETRSDCDRWLEAIAFALLAIAGLIAIALVLLWRGVAALRRIADGAALVQQQQQQQQRN